MTVPGHPGLPQADRWHRETTSQDWGIRVIDHIRTRLAQADGPVKVEWMETEGVVLTVVYRNSAVPKPAVCGLRWRLNYPPRVGKPEPDLAAWLGDWIADNELIEPAAGMASKQDQNGICWRDVPPAPA